MADLESFDSYVSIDLEFNGNRDPKNTPLEDRICSIIEIGAVKIINGK